MKRYNLIRKMRKFHEYKQEDMAEQLDLDPKTYRKIENKEQHIPQATIDKIAKMLNIAPEVLKATEDENISMTITFNHQEGGQVIVNNIIKNENERELYERMLKDKDAAITQLSEMLEIIKSIAPHQK